MKTQTFSLWFMILSIIISVLIIGSITFAQGNPEEYAPTADHVTFGGNPHPAPGPTMEALPIPISRVEDALEQIFKFDSEVANWDEKWTVDDVIQEATVLEGIESLQTWPKGQLIEIGRFKVGLFPTRAEADHALSGDLSWYAPEAEAEAGEVWVLVIYGGVTARFLGGPENENVIFDGIVYQISSRTGSLLSIQTGLPLTDEYGRPILRDEQGNVLDENGNIIWPAQSQ